MIFVGEQTSYTHAWIASALESGIRGGVQLLLGKSEKRNPDMTYEGHCDIRYPTKLADLSSRVLVELGLVDEAKDTVEKWMARWIEVVSDPLRLPQPRQRRSYL